MIDLTILEMYDKEMQMAIERELQRQRRNIELIASENFVSLPVMAACGSHLTNKYAEGYPDARYYGGCKYVDVVEDLARDRLTRLFGCEHCNVQPHSGSNANLAVLFAACNAGDTIMGMDLNHGGHLSHGSPVNISGKYFNVIHYGVRKEDELLDYDQMEDLAIKNKPKLIISGASSYPRVIDFARIRKICDKVGALMMVDIAHIAGLVAAGLHPSPVPYADFVTSTTHKTLRGPRGGIIMCKEEWAKAIDKAIFPGIQGGPLMHIIAGKAVAFKEALSPEFKEYQKQIVKNAKEMAKQFSELGLRMVTGGTDNHLILLDLEGKATGKELTENLDKVNITVNKNAIPFDTQKPAVTSGIRVGTPAMTTRGFNGYEFKKVAKLIHRVLTEGEQCHEEVRETVKKMLSKHQLYRGQVR